MPPHLARPKKKRESGRKLARHSVVLSFNWWFVKCDCFIFIPPPLNSLIDSLYIHMPNICAWVTSWVLLNTSWGKIISIGSVLKYCNVYNLFLEVFKLYLIKRISFFLTLNRITCKKCINFNNAWSNQLSLEKKSVNVEFIIIQQPRDLLSRF